MHPENYYLYLNALVTYRGISYPSFPPRYFAHGKKICPRGRFSDL
jgi:hypothetical protein